MSFWDNIKWFTRDEFRCPCGECTGFPVEPQTRLVVDLELIRDAWGQPIHNNSGVRCAAHNTAVGGAPDSAHLTGWAADISITDSMSRHEFLAFANPTFHRIGVGETVVHVDHDPTKAARAMWLYHGEK